MATAAQVLADSSRDLSTRIQGALELVRNAVIHFRPPQLSTDGDLNGQVNSQLSSNSDDVAGVAT